MSEKPIKKRNRMKSISISLPDSYLEGMDELVRVNMYISRSAIIRTAIRDLLRKEVWKKKR